MPHLPHPPHLPRPHLPRPGRPHPGPGMSLYLLSPVIAELMLGSSPPLTFALLSWTDIPMYGGGAILIRELALRWRKGWPTIVALGVAYAIAEEGIAIRTFFDAAGGPTKDLGTYGWFAGANWVFIAGIVLYHAFISIALPIMLVTMAFPGRAKEPWVSGRWLRRSTAGLVGIVALWLVAIWHPAVDGRWIVASLGAIGAIGFIARRLPERIPFDPGHPPSSAPRLRRVVAVVAVSNVAILLSVYDKGFGTPPIVAIALIYGILAITLRWIGRNAASPNWTDRHRLALATGVFAWFWCWSPFLEMTGAHGQVIVTLIGIWAVRRAWVRLARDEADRATAPAMAGAAGGAGPTAEGGAATA